MLVDHSLIFSEAQELTADAASAKVLDLEGDTAQLSHNLSVACVVASDITGTLLVKLQDCDTDNGTFTDCGASGTAEAPVAGSVIQFPFPYATKRYVRLYYSGATAGKVNSFLTEGRQLWTAAKQADSISAAPVAEVVAEA